MRRSINLYLYILEPKENLSYRFMEREVYDSIVVVAKDKESAKLIHPHKCEKTKEAFEENYNLAGEWVKDPDDLNVTYIGIAAQTLSEDDVVHTDYLES